MRIILIWQHPPHYTCILAMSMVSEQKQIFAFIVGKFWYRNKTNLFISQWLTIEANQTDVALNYIKNGAKQRDLFQIFWE